MDDASRPALSVWPRHGWDDFRSHARLEPQARTHAAAEAVVQEDVEEGIVKREQMVI
jgi:hypothetical protein